MDAEVPSETKAATFRLFVALPVPEEVKKQIRHAQDQLRRELPEQCARWTGLQQWHLTLKFLGKVDVKQLTALTDAVRAACQGCAPLQLRAEQVGCFPDLRAPRVVWVGVRDAEGGLTDMARAIRDATAAFSNEAPEGTFAGHITIARIKNLRRSQAEILVKLVHGMTVRAFGEWTADAVEIMRSELTADGARHTCLARLPLKTIT